VAAEADGSLQAEAGWEAIHFQAMGEAECEAGGDDTREARLRDVVQTRGWGDGGEVEEVEKGEAEGEEGHSLRGIDVRAHAPCLVWLLGDGRGMVCDLGRLAVAEGDGGRGGDEAAGTAAVVPFRPLLAPTTAAHHTHQLFSLQLHRTSALRQALLLPDGVSGVPSRAALYTRARMQCMDVTLGREVAFGLLTYAAECR